MAAKPPPDESFRRLARASWMLVIVGVAELVCTHALGRTINHGGAAKAGWLLFAVTALTGIILAVAGLCGVPQHGRRGILVPALAGLGLWLGILAVIAGMILHSAFARFHDFEPLRPVEGGVVLKDPELGFSFDVPPDYQPFAKSAMPAGSRYAWLKMVDFEPSRVLEVKVLDGSLPRRRLSPGDLPPGGRFSLTSLSWRGLPVDAIVIHGRLGDRDYLTINVQIPLRDRAIQIGFGGPAGSERELLAVAGQVLGSLDGETNR